MDKVPFFDRFVQHALRLLIYAVVIGPDGVRELRLCPVDREKRERVGAYDLFGFLPAVNVIRQRRDLIFKPPGRPVSSK